MNPSVAFYFDTDKWHAELAKLRAIVLSCGLTEELKWGVPCYTFQKKNVVLLHVFKEYCAILFIKGALLQDADGILVQQTENVQAGRQLRFTDVQQLAAIEATLKAYIYEAIEVEKAGLKVAYKQVTDLAVPDELQRKFDEDTPFKIAFDALTPGRQRAYTLHFSAPKQAATRASRIEKCTQAILLGKGLNE